MTGVTIPLNFLNLTIGSFKVHFKNIFLTWCELNIPKPDKGFLDQIPALLNFTVLCVPLILNECLGCLIIGGKTNIWDWNWIEIEFVL